jgi:hypothetical protein
MRRKTNAYTVLVRKYEERRKQEDLGADGNMILTTFLKKYNWRD